MNGLKISSVLSVSGQLDQNEVAAIATAGFAAVLNNRPDFEHGEPEQATAAQIEAAAHSAGLAFASLPFAAADICPALAWSFAQTVANLPKPIWAYCRSGARTTRIYEMAVALGYLRPDDLSLGTPPTLG